MTQYYVLSNNIDLYAGRNDTEYPVSKTIARKTSTDFTKDQIKDAFPAVVRLFKTKEKALKYAQVTSHYADLTPVWLDKEYLHEPLLAIVTLKEGFELGEFKSESVFEREYERLRNITTLGIKLGGWSAEQSEQIQRLYREEKSLPVAQLNWSVQYAEVPWNQLIIDRIQLLNGSLIMERTNGKLNFAHEEDQEEEYKSWCTLS